MPPSGREPWCANEKNQSRTSRANRALDGLPTHSQFGSGMEQSEQQIQRAVFEHLAIRAASAVFAFHPPNGGWRSRVEAAILKGVGVRAGLPDVVAVKNGQCYALELKA